MYSFYKKIKIIIHLFKRMLNYDPRKRASSKQLIKIIGEIKDFSDVVSKSFHH